MAAQDLFPYSSTLVGLRNIYYVFDNNFYINSPCILATGKIVSKGKEYLFLFHTTDTAGIRMLDVILVDCFYQEEGIINLIVRDIKSNRVFTIHQCLKGPDSDYFVWVLVDLNYFIDKMNDKAIRQYCGNCNDPKERTNKEINHKSKSDDLMDFEF